MENLDSIDDGDSTQDNVIALISLNEFLKNERVDLNSIGQFLPDNKQLKSLVNCIDDSTGELISLARIDTSNITNMKSIFYNSTRKDFSGIEKWNVSSVVSFAWCFCNAEHFNADISDWDVSNAKQFRDMFYKATVFNQPIGAKWDTKSVEGMIGMFYYAKNFNNGGQPFGEKWVMDKVKLSYYMFCGAENFNQPINHWNVSNIINMNAMFMNAKAFNQPLDLWNVSSVEKMQNMFNRAESFNQDLSAWSDKLGKVINAKRAFADTKALSINFIQSWKLPIWCNTEHILKGSLLKSDLKLLKSKKLDNYFIAFIKGDKESSIKSKFSESWQNDDFYNNCLPENIRKDYKVSLAKSNDGELVKGDKDSWDFALYEVLDSTFLVSKNSDSEIFDDVNIDFSIIQGRKENDFNKYSEESTFNKSAIQATCESNQLTIYFDTKNIWILNTIEQNSDLYILSIVNFFILSQSYKAKMESFEENARNNNPKELQKYYKEICEFDLFSYRNIPIIQEKSNLFLQNIWRKMSAVYMVAQTHDELKEVILQMAQVIGGEIKEQEKKAQDEAKKKFDWLMGFIAILSALGAILAAVPVVQNLLN